MGLHVQNFIMFNSYLLQRCYEPGLILGTGGGHSSAQNSATPHSPGVYIPVGGAGKQISEWGSSSGECCEEKQNKGIYHPAVS